MCATYLKCHHMMWKNMNRKLLLNYKHSQRKLWFDIKNNICDWLVCFYLNESNRILVIFYWYLSDCCHKLKWWWFALWICVCVFVWFGFGFFSLLFLKRKSSQTYTFFESMMRNKLPFKHCLHSPFCHSFRWTVFAVGLCVLVCSLLFFLFHIFTRHQDT